jgi:hypothetical protein
MKSIPSGRAVVWTTWFLPAFLALPLFAAETVAEPPKPAPAKAVAAKPAPPPKPSGIIKSRADAAKVAEAFRMEAAVDLYVALERWALKRCRLKWDWQVELHLEDGRPLWKDFFAYATVLMGPQKGDQAIIGYYNAWADGLVVMQFEGDLGAGPLKDYYLMSGEHWRGESIRTELRKNRMYLWPGPPRLFQDSLEKTWRGATEAFAKRYPADGPCELLTEEVKKLLGKPPEELDPVRLRLYGRYVMHKSLAAAGNTEKGSPLTQRILLLRELVREDGPGKLAEAFPGAANQAAIEGVFKLPAEMRKNLALVYSCHNVEQEDLDKGVVVLGYPPRPDFFLRADFNLESPERRGMRLGVIQLNLPGTEPQGK